MPGIAGIVDVTRPGAVAGSIESMIAPMRRRSWYVDAAAETDGAALAAIALDDRCLAERDGCILVWQGGVFGVDAGDGLLADALLQRYLSGGPEALAGLNGVYAAAVYDGRTRRLHLVNDRYGFRQVYLWRHGDTLRFATEYKAFLQCPGFSRKLDERALADYMQLTYVTDTDTLYADVKLLPPATIATFDNGRLSLRTYWEPRMERVPAGERDLDDLTAEYMHRLETAIAPRVGDKNLVLLTGGLDSRTLGGIIARQPLTHPVTAVSMGFRKSYDVRYGAKLAQILGFEHHFIDVPSSYVADHAEEGGWRLEGALSAHGYWSFELDPLLEKGRTFTVTHGLLGDSLAGERSLTAKPFIDGQTEDEAFNYLFRRFFATTFSDDDLKTLFRPSLYEATKGSTRQRILDTFRRYPSPDIYDRIAYTDLRQRQRQFTRQQIEIYGEFAHTRIPFADNDFVDFMYTLPHELREGKSLYKRMIARYLPETAAAPYTVTGLPMNATAWQKLAVRGKNRIKYKVLPKVTFGRYKPTHYGVWLKYDEWLRTGSRAYVTEILDHAPYFEDHFQMDTVRRWLADHMEGRGNHYGQLCILLTFALWRKQFGS